MLQMSVWERLCRSWMLRDCRGSLHADNASVIDTKRTIPCMRMRCLRSLMRLMTGSITCWVHRSTSSLTILPSGTSRTQLYPQHCKLVGRKSYLYSTPEDYPHSREDQYGSRRSLTESFAYEEVIEIGNSPTLELAFLEAVDISTSTPCMQPRQHTSTPCRYRRCESRLRKLMCVASWLNIRQST